MTTSAGRLFYLPVAIHTPICTKQKQSVAIRITPHEQSAIFRHVLSVNVGQSDKVSYALSISATVWTETRIVLRSPVLLCSLQTQLYIRATDLVRNRHVRASLFAGKERKKDKREVRAYIVAAKLHHRLHFRLGKLRHRNRLDTVRKLPTATPEQQAYSLLAA